MLQKTFKYRLYPSKTQEQWLNKTVEGCRQWYNNYLGTTRENPLHFGGEMKAEILFFSAIT